VSSEKISVINRIVAPAGNTFSAMLADMENFYSSAAGEELSCVPIELDVSKEKYFAGQLAGGVWHR
jgi:hypothetical protein